MRNEPRLPWFFASGDSASDLHWNEQALSAHAHRGCECVAQQSAGQKQGRRRRRRMRTILIGMLVATGIGLAGTSATSAAPANGAAINDAAAIIDPVDQVQH